MFAPRTGPYAESRIEALLATMTNDEKVAMCHGKTTFTSAGCERLGLPDLMMSDGPHGVRAEVSPDSWLPLDGVDDAITYLPVATALAATWNPQRAHDFGDVLGAEARARGKDVILGPGVNIIRTPLCGRNFEYFGEDPCQVATMAVPVIQAIQSHDVAACVKHYALNNQELNRMRVDVLCDERSLHEIYLPAFEAAVREAGVLTVMGAYNRFRGQHCCHNAYLLVEILKRSWGFAGLVVSDWGGVHDSDEAVANGLDIEMGGRLDRQYLDAPLREGLANGRYRPEQVEAKVRRILRVMLALGVEDPQRSRGAKNTPQHQASARRIAEEALVLLKNDAGVLPLEPDRLKTLAVIGENATMVHAGGGGSSGLKALYEVSPLEALRERLPGVEIIHERGYPCLPAGMEPIPPQMLSAPDAAGIGAWRKEIYSNRRHEGEPMEVTSVPTIELACDDVPCAGLTPGDWSVLWHGELIAPADEEVRLVVHGGDNWILRLDEEVIASVWDLTAPGLVIEPVSLRAGQRYRITLELHPKHPGASMCLGWVRAGSGDESVLPDMQTQAVAAAARADAVLIFAGSSHLQDVEGQDRKSFVLPGNQDALIEAVAAANPRTAVFLFGGSPVALPWADAVPAIVQAWYPGCEGGRALAALVCGDSAPSGRLPFSWPVALEDCAAHAHDAYHADEVDYHEGLAVGYRWHDGAGPAPRFPFGHGLGYTTFSYDDQVIEGDADDGVAAVYLTLTNTGTRAGAEVVQLYVHDEESSLPRPPKELKGFSKIFLEPGASHRLRMPLTKRDLSFYDPQATAWVAEPGDFTVLVGASAGDIRCTGRFTYAGS